MANSERISLIDTYILYGAESAFGTAVSVTNMFGGLIQRASIDIDRSVSEHAGMVGTAISDGRVTSKYTTGTVSVGATLDFMAQDFGWLEYLLSGTKTGSGTVSSPYVYSIGKSVKSLTVAENIDNITTDSERTFAGMLINSASIKCAVGEAVSCSVDLIGGKIAVDTTKSSAVAQITDDLYNFAGGTIEMPDATSIGNVIDSVEFSYDNAASMLYGFSEEASNGRLGKITTGLKITLKYLDDDQMTRLLGSATAITSQTPVTLSLKFTKGTGLYTDFVFSNVVISKISDSHDLNEWMVEDITVLAQSLVVTEAKTA